MSLPKFVLLYIFFIIVGLIVDMLMNMSLGWEPSIIGVIIISVLMSMFYYTKKYTYKPTNSELFKVSLIMSIIFVFFLFCVNIYVLGNNFFELDYFLLIVYVGSIFIFTYQTNWFIGLKNK